MACLHTDRKIRAKGLCGSCYNREYYKMNGNPKRRHIPSSARRAKIRHRYGIEPHQYEEMLEAQNNACAICEQEKPYRLYVDHNHQTGKVRALLCAGCNTLVGSMEHPLRAKAEDYLARLELWLIENEGKKDGSA